MEATICNQPAVSCLCLTYGRPHVLEEAVESFLRQDYSGPKELLVLNDLPEQSLSCESTDVRVINVSARFRSVGEKRNASAALAAHDIFFVWDDDDIFLPHRLSYSIDHLDPIKGFYKPSKAWVLNGEILSGPTSNLFHSGACFTRELFNMVHGYPHIGSGQDLVFEQAVERHLKTPKNDNRIRPEEIFYIYRWNGTSSYHLSAFGRDRPGVCGNARVAAFVERQIQDQRVPVGDVTLHPHWKRNYVELVTHLLGEREALCSKEVGQSEAV